MDRSTPDNSGGKVRLSIDEKGLEYKKWKNGTTFPVAAGEPNLSSYCNNTFDFHWHDGVEITAITDGRMEYLVNDKRYVMEKGDCVFVNSGAMHSGRALDDGGCRYLTVSFLTSALDSDPSSYFAEKYFGGVMDSETLPSMFFQTAHEETQAVADLCLKIRDMLREKNESWELEIKEILCRLWGILRRTAQTQAEVNEDSVSVARIKKAIRYMNENYRAKIGLEDIARACNLSRSEFCRCFKRITRQTPFDYLMDLRIRKSVRLLENEGCTVTEAALASGFSGSSYYAEVFRRYMHCTPREYIKKVRKRHLG